MPGFCSKPIWFQRTPDATRSVWLFVAAIHMVYLPFFPILSPTDTNSPITLYPLAVLVYLALRGMMAGVRGYPILTTFQTVWVLLLPLYGPVVFMALAYVGWWIGYGRAG